MLLQRNADPGPFPAPKQKFCRPHHKALSLLYDIQGPASSFNFFLLTAAQTIKKVLSSRHVRMDRTHTGKFDGESVRAALRRVRGSTANFVPRGIPGGRNFCRAAARRNGFPLERVVFDTPNNAGAGFAADPRRGTLSFVTQKFFCFGAINNRRNIGSIPLCRHIGWVFYPSVQVVSGTCTPLISSPGMVPRGCYK